MNNFEFIYSDRVCSENERNAKKACIEALKGFINRGMDISKFCQVKKIDD